MFNAEGQPTDNEGAVNNVSEHDVGDFWRKFAMGDLLRGNLVQHVRQFNFVTAPVSPGSLATVQTCVLPDKSKASYLLRATARAGAATVGELTVVQYTGTAPSTGQIAVGPNGNLVALIADGWTNIDMVYMPERGDVVELTLPVTSHVLTIPASVTAKGVILLLEATALEGTLTGAEKILIPAAAAPATTQARLNLAKTTVTFATADAVTRARVKLLVGVPAAQSIAGILDASPTMI